MATSGPEPPAASAAQLQQAIASHQRGQLAEAERGYQSILARDPNNFDALQLLGLIASQCGVYEDAVQLIGRALAINPNHASAQHNRGVAFLSLGRFEEALACFEKAISLRPVYADALTNRGSALYRMKRWEDARASYEQALMADPRQPFALNNLSVVLADLDRPDDALAAAERALAVNRNNADAHYNRANALRTLRRLDEAMTAYDRALKLKPDYPNAHLNAALCSLQRGDYARGWEEYEWRWRADQHAGTARDFAAPQWQGEDISGKVLLLHAEQGLGDTLQFCRYAALAAARGARVVLEVHPTLKTLLSDLSGVSEIVARGATLPPFDFHCPLLSLPRAFRTTVATIPVSPAYVKADPDKVASWQARLSGTTAPRVGVMWRGNPGHGNDRNRSIPIEKLAPLVASGATIVSLQKDISAADAAWAAANGLLQFAPELHDFSDTAALVATMDVVVAVDTSVAHLAGALGKTTWVLLPFRNVDWRWGMEDEESRWYPTARLFRQPALGDWDSVMARVVRELSA